MVTAPACRSFGRLSALDASRRLAYTIGDGVIVGELRTTMTWNVERLLTDFVTVAALAGVALSLDDLQVEKLLAPHSQPARLPEGQMAVYVFSHDEEVLKVGKVGPKSSARYTSQHYNPGSAPSTLAASLLGDADRPGLSEADRADIGLWMRSHLVRVNILLPSSLGVPVLSLLECFLQCRLMPTYEGFKSQHT